MADGEEEQKAQGSAVNNSGRAVVNDFVSGHDDCGARKRLGVNTVLLHPSVEED